MAGEVAPWGGAGWGEVAGEGLAAVCTCVLGCCLRWRNTKRVWRLGRACLLECCLHSMVCVCVRARAHMHHTLRGLCSRAALRCPSPPGPTTTAATAIPAGHATVALRSRPRRPRCWVQRRPQPQHRQRQVLWVHGLRRQLHGGSRWAAGTGHWPLGAGHWPLADRQRPFHMQHRACQLQVLPAKGPLEAPGPRLWVDPNGSPLGVCQALAPRGVPGASPKASRPPGCCTWALSQPPARGRGLLSPVVGAAIPHPRFQFQLHL